jgi:hypothetical protein
MAITATAIGYDALHPLPAKLADQSGSGLDMVSGLTFIVAFATVGAVLAWKKPRNPIGWLLSGSGLAYALGGSGALEPAHVSVWISRHQDRSWPGRS